MPLLAGRPTHLSSGVAPGIRLVVAIAPDFTIGLVLPSRLRSTAESESNGNPVPSPPILAHTSSGPSIWPIASPTPGQRYRLRRSQLSANQPQIGGR
jgi:hypothetical protein